MSIFEYIVSTKLNSYLDDDIKSPSNYKFILAISGGVDSMVLFQSLKDFGLYFYTVHFNHNYHTESNEVSLFLNDFIKNSNSKKHFNISLDLSDTKNFEGDARNKRYFHLENLRRRLKCDFILTAHHLDDQIETLHMRRIQNAHWSNSLGIRERIASIRRPLLSLSKYQIRAFAKEKQILWKEDPSNGDNSFLRNKTRNMDLPKLLNKNPEYATKLLCQQAIDEKRFEKIVKKINKTNFRAEEFTFGISLNFLKYSSFDEVGKKLIIQHYIKKNFNSKSVQYSYSNWKNLFTYLESINKRASPFRLSQKISIYRGNSKIYIIRNKTLTFNETSINERCNWFDGRITVSGLQRFNEYADKFTASLPENFECKVRQWKSSDTYISATNGHKCKVSDLFIDKKLNYIQKRIQPIVTDSNDTILWIPGLAHASISSALNFKKYSWESSK